MKKNKQDVLLQIDFDSAFPDTPQCIHDAVELAGVAIHRRERRRNVSIRVLSCAAAVIFVVAGIALFLNNEKAPKNDLIMPPSLSEADVYVDPETIVYASKTGAYYHADATCELMDDLAVELPLITAVEFEKQPCPACAMDVVLKDEKEEREESEKLQSAAGELKEILSEDEEPIYKSSFFGGSISVYEGANEDYICVTDPTPDDSVFRYVLSGIRNIPAEEYYRVNGGPGIYADYDEKVKMLVTDYGDYAESHTAFDNVIAVELLDGKTGECAWRFTPEQYEIFRTEKHLFMSENSMDNPNLSLTLDY